MQRPEARTPLIGAGLLLGLVLWVCGIESVFGEGGLLSPLALLCGAIIAGLAAFLLMSARVDRDLPGSQLGADGALLFFVVFGAGLSAIGLSFSDAFSALAQLAFGLVGVGLIAWSPQVLRRFRIER